MTYRTLNSCVDRSSEHTKAVSKSCFYHIRAHKHIRDSLDSSMIRTIAAALVTSRLLCKLCLIRHPLKISRLQRIQNTLAPVVGDSRTPNRTSNLATLSQLHWLPIHDRIKFKIATMTHKANL